MQEKLLHLIWQHQMFRHRDLITTQGQSLQILDPGFQNHDAGPDFSEARVLLDEITWIGDVEIHEKENMWNEHGHQHDRLYNKVILHVVWEAREASTIQRKDGTSIPCLELQHRVDGEVLTRAGVLLEKQDNVPCSDFLPGVDQGAIDEMFQQALMERLMEKAIDLHKLHKQTRGDWERVFLIALFRSFGFRVNNDAFEKLALRIPLKIVNACYQKEFDMQALLFGMAGFLGGRPLDDYHRKLQEKFRFLRHKHGLSTPLRLENWKFGSIRPANFPTVRLAQLTSMLSANRHLFRRFLEEEESAFAVFDVMLPEYWQHHYYFSKRFNKKQGKVGRFSQQLLIVNILAPLLIAYARHAGEQGYVDRALRLLHSLPAENHKITRLWERQGLELNSAAASQGGYHLFNAYCSKKRCLECTIGAQILRSNN